MPRAVMADEFGPPESYQLREFDPGPPKDDEVRVAIKAAGVSYVDVLTAMGKYQFHPPLPFIPGSEAAGVVEQVGKDVTNLKVGEVFGARLVPGEVWQLSGAGYQFPEDLVPALLAVMEDDVQDATDASNTAEELEAAIRSGITETIIHAWLHYLVGETGEIGDSTLDREPLVVDRYRLFDRAALAELLRAEEAFHGDPEVACVWVPEGGDEDHPVAVTPDQDTLETSGSRAVDLDRLREWLEAHAAEAVAFTEREVFGN